MKHKLIIVSGGMDSTTLLHEQKDVIKRAVTFWYGQKHRKEISFARESCVKLNIPWMCVDISNLLPHLKSNLLQTGEEIPEGHYTDENQKLTVVPFRNAIMLSIACAIAESQDCDTVLIANHANDFTIYPDCRDQFIQAMAQAMKVGTYAGIILEAPYTFLTKRKIALIGRSLGIDYGKETWSCYKGGAVHCGKCGTCVERKEALEGFDTTVYGE